MLTTSHQEIHFEKKLLMNSQEKLKEIGKANKQGGEANTLPLPFAFYQRPFSPPPMRSLNSVSNMGRLADASTYCACSEYFSE